MNFGSLTPSEVAAIRRVGGTAYVALVEVRGSRGRKYRPVRGDVWRTEEQARKDLADLRRRFVGGRQLHAASAVYMVDASGDAVAVDA